MNWNGNLPRRRYAIFYSPFFVGGKYATVIYGDDIETAEKWGGFVTWLGGVHIAETRKICK